MPGLTALWESSNTVSHHSREVGLADVYLRPVLHVVMHVFVTTCVVTRVCALLRFNATVSIEVPARTTVGGNFPGAAPRQISGIYSPVLAGLYLSDNLPLEYETLMVPGSKG